MELKTPPLFWIGPELTKRLLNGNSPVLSDKQVRQANAGAGLNSVTWVGAFDTDHWQSVEAHSAMFAAFVGEHQGFLLKELVGFGMSVEALEGTLRSGALLLSPVDGRYVDSVDRPLQEIFAKPHLVGLTRELAMARIRTWVGSLFVYHPPQFAFRPSEQRLLLAALQGGTDEDLAAALGISLSAVKKTWRSIYDRVAATGPGSFPITRRRN